MAVVSGAPGLNASASLTVHGAVQMAPVTVTMSAQAGMNVAGQIGAVPAFTPTTLEEHVAALSGERDPILLGATGYLDDVYTSRMVGDTV